VCLPRNQLRNGTHHVSLKRMVNFDLLKVQKRKFLEKQVQTIEDPFFRLYFTLSHLFG
jgi:hypothetical protein